ncbi:MAG: LamG domain-containing protein, partial [Limisphaerales bacterium]
MKLTNAISLILCGSFIASGAAQAQSGLWTNLVSYWPFDTVTANSTGTVTPDLAIGNDLILSNAPALVPGEDGNCFQFNGTSQFLGLVHSTEPWDNGLPIYYSTNGYTVAFWVNGPASQPDNSTVYSEGSLANSGLLLDFATEGGSLRLYIRNDEGTAVVNNYISQATVFDNTWHFVAWSDYQGTGTLYIDGNVDMTTNYPYSLAGGPNANDDSVGVLYRSTPVDFFTGMVDDLALWNRVLSPSEIQTVMTSGIPTPIPP